MSNDSQTNRFRSSLLRPALPVRAWGDLMTILTRTFWVFLAIVIILMTILLVGLRVFPKTGFGYALYWFHDVIYLGIKGYTYTLFYPYSLIWYCILSFTVLLISISYLIDRSFLLGPHTLLLRFLIHFSPVYPMLFIFAKWIKKIRMNSEFMRLTLSAERELLMTQVISETNLEKVKSRCRDLATMTSLQVQIETLFAHTSSLPLAVNWEEALVVILLNTTGKSEEERKNRLSLINSLLLSFPDLFSHIDEKNLSWLSEQNTNQPFEADSLLRDLARLVWLSHLDVEKRENVFSAMINKNEKSFQAADGFMKTMVIRSVDNRRHLIEKAVDRLSRKGQSRFLSNDVLQGIGDNRYLNRVIESNELQSDSLASLRPMLSGTSYGWNLSMMLAFHESLLDENFERGLAYYEALDTLAFIQGIEVSTQNNVSQMEASEKTIPFGLPSVIHALLAAVFQNRARLKLMPVVKNLLSYENGVLTKDDFIRTEQGDLAYLQTAGPIKEVEQENHQSRKDNWEAAGPGPSNKVRP
jgi:hypothetical protein